MMQDAMAEAIEMQKKECLKNCDTADLVRELRNRIVLQECKKILEDTTRLV